LPAPALFRNAANIIEKSMAATGGCGTLVFVARVTIAHNGNTKEVLSGKLIVR
jgi:hypothetical protein